MRGNKSQFHSDTTQSMGWRCGWTEDQKEAILKFYLALFSFDLFLTLIFKDKKKGQDAWHGMAWHGKWRVVYRKALASVGGERGREFRWG